MTPFTPEEVGQLIASVPDNRHWKLVVTYAGQAYLLDYYEYQKRKMGEENDQYVPLTNDEWVRQFHGESEEDKRLLAEKSDRIYVAFETFGDGNGYVGFAAANDKSRVERIYHYLKGSWPKASYGKYIG
jgi:hypothetical protein